MNFDKNSTGCMLRGAVYDAQIILKTVPRIILSFDGREIMNFPLTSDLDMVDQKETISNIAISGITEGKDFLLMEVTADSNIWKSHKFVWRFEQERISYYHEVEGEGALGRCNFLSSGNPYNYSKRDSAGTLSNASPCVPKYHIFNPTLANAFDFEVAQPHYMGVGNSENASLQHYYLLNTGGIYSPGPLFMAFYEGQSTMGFGIGTEPGNYRFNGLEYTGATAEAASFYVNYLGYTRAEGKFKTPEVSLTFNYDPYACLRDYVKWMDEKGFGTQLQYQPAAWHREPIYCGWCSQAACMAEQGGGAASHCTQANYEKWISELEESNIPFGTIIIDDKWQKYYGTFEVDTQKWPDMPGFVRKQHEKGRHVILWIPTRQTEGCPEEFLARDAQGNLKGPSGGLEAYDKFVFDGITRLIKETDVDGFKEDWIGGGADTPNWTNYGELHGIETRRRFQVMLAKALYALKPDGIMETQTPNPLFRDSSTRIRDNDLWFSTRDILPVMRKRVRTARIAGWDLVDVEDGSAINLKEWLKYLPEQPNLGIPSILSHNRIETSKETIPQEGRDFLAVLWHAYRRKQGLEE